MKKQIASLLLVAGLILFAMPAMKAQSATVEEQIAAMEFAETDDIPTDAFASVDDVESKPFHQVLKQKFIEGGALWMTPILLCFILGLALIIERIIYLNLATTNTKKLLENVETALNKDGVEAAKDICRKTKGPVASIFYQGLDRVEEGVEVVEKSLTSYGGVAMGRMESNLNWISMVIAVAPMLGFLGTVVGMVMAFDEIEIAGDISPTIVAGGMKVALLTTVFGLIVAIICQVLYNYISSKIESLVNSMEDASIAFMDMIVKYERKK
jgi:biopolymer transport protein ExbB